MAVLDGRIDEKREKLKVLGVTITLIFTGISLLQFKFRPVHKELDYGSRIRGKCVKKVN